MSWRQTRVRLTINGVQISRAEDRPTLAELQRLINDETARTNVQAEIDADGNLVLENAPGYEIDNIARGSPRGLFDDQRHSNAFGRFALDGAKHLGSG